MLSESFSKAPESLRIFFNLTAILLLLNFLIGPASCKSYGLITNSSLKTQTVYRYSEEAGSLLPWQNKVCQPQDDPCASVPNDPENNCCPGFYCYDPEHSGEGTCQCFGDGVSCSTANNFCCFGTTCNNGVCCTAQNNPCSTNENTCCGELVCDPALEKCGVPCKTRGTTCDTSATDEQNNCCPGFYCIDKGGEQKCTCLNKGDQCTPGDKNTCCSGMTCNADSSQCCTPENDPCNEGEDTCCDGFKCGSDGSKLVCQCNGATCNSDSDCCAQFICLFSAIGLPGVCVLPNVLELKNATIS